MHAGLEEQSSLSRQSIYPSLSLSMPSSQISLEITGEGNGSGLCVGAGMGVGTRLGSGAGGAMTWITAHNYWQDTQKNYIMKNS